MKRKWQHNAQTAPAAQPNQELLHKPPPSHSLFTEPAMRRAPAGAGDVKPAPNVLRWGAEFVPAAATAQQPVEPRRSRDHYLLYVRHSVFMLYLTEPSSCALCGMPEWPGSWHVCLRLHPGHDARGWCLF